MSSLSGIAALDCVQELCLRVATSFHRGALSSTVFKGRRSKSSSSSSGKDFDLALTAEAISQLENELIASINADVTPQTARQVLQPSVLHWASRDGTRHGLQRHFLDVTGVNINLDQPRRGFKSRRTYNAFNANTSPSSSNLVKKTLEKLRRPSSAPASKKFDEITSEFAAQPEVQDKLKVAFAEGYSAADGAGSSPKQTAMERFLKITSYIVTIWLLFMVIRLVGTGAGGGRAGFGFMSSDQFEVNPEFIRSSFSDVKGADEATQELREIVEFLRNPESFRRVGAKLPKGVLLVGPPGNGKTLLAKAVAGEADVPFFQASGSQFEEVFVGTGARRVRQLFATAKERAPCVVFIDEIDSVGAKRTSSEIHPYANQTINQLLAEMDGFDTNEGVIVLGATNRRDNLDKALLRPGRFDLEVRVFPPDLKGRRDILELYLARVCADASIDVDLVARTTVGFSGAELENLVNQAALRAALDGADEVTADHLEFARDKVMMGPEWKNRKPDADCLRRTAFHEAGHTLVALHTKGCHPVHKVTIVPRGMALGLTASVPAKEILDKTMSELLAEMDMCMGGRVAEEIVYGSEHVSTGASNDFEKATRIATAMVKHFGMSDRIGPRSIEDASGPTDNGMSLVRVNDLSPSLSEVVDTEVRRLLNESYERATRCLRTHRRELDVLARELLEQETLSGDQVRQLVGV